MPSATITRTTKKGQPRKKEDIDFVKSFLNSLPKLSSHYCRTSSTKLYIVPTFESMTELYNLYTKECKSNSNSRFTFDKTFAKYNLSLFQPMKYECDMS